MNKILKYNKKVKKNMIYNKMKFYNNLLKITKFIINQEIQNKQKDI